MKKRLVLILCVALVLSSIAAAEERVENYNKHQSLTLDFTLDSGLRIERARENSRIDSITAKISFFPRDDDRQKVLDLDLTSTPEAETRKTDTDVVFTWDDRSATNILQYAIHGRVKTFGIFAEVDRVVKFPLQNLDDDLLQYTKASKNIDLNDAIESQARTIVSGETDLYKASFLVADWVKANIKYDLSTLTAEAVQKSSWVLANKEGVCDEITNLFISMLRSLGVPARFVSGVVYSNLDYKFGPHGWAEVYFPGYGWIPFDVTFGQYGWLDPSHMKLDDTLDSGSPTAAYSWVTYGAEIVPDDIDLAASVVETGQTIDVPVTFSLDVESGEVGPGSYVPLIVTVQNLRDYYVSPSIIVKKAPELTEKNVKELLLGPKETQNVVWIMKIPTEAQEGYSYTSALEVVSGYGGVATASVRYAKDGAVSSLEHAKAIAISFLDKSKKKEFTSLQLRCYPEKKIYYTGDEILIRCTSKNDGDSVTYSLCMKSNCERISLAAGQSLETTFSLHAVDSGRVAIAAENEERVKYAYVDLNVIKVADIALSGLKPMSVEYADKEVQLNFQLESNSELKDVLIDFGFDTLKYDALAEERQLTINTNGKTLYVGLALDITYKDASGKDYQKHIPLAVQVNNVPWYARFVRWIAGLF